MNKRNCEHDINNVADFDCLCIWCHQCETYLRECKTDDELKRCETV